MAETKGKSLSEEYPSLQLAYEQVKNILAEQKDTARDYGARAITLLATATAIAGIGIPLGFSRTLETIHLFWHITASDVVIVPIILYVIVVLFAFRVYKLGVIKTMNEPTVIRESFWHLNPNKFLYEILLHIEDAFKHNDRILKERQKYLKPLLPLVITEVGAIILWSGLIFKIIPVSW